MKKGSQQESAVYWVRQDLRLSDNPALSAACKSGLPVYVVFIDDPAPQTTARVGSASRVWLHHSLLALNRDIESVGGSLITLSGDPQQVLPELLVRLNARLLVWNRLYDPVSIRRDEELKAQCAEFLEVRSFAASLLYEPWTVSKPDGNPYRVYTPFWRKFAERLPGDSPLTRPRNLLLHKADAEPGGSEAIHALSLLPALAWPESMMAHWSVGEAAARKQCDKFIDRAVSAYGESRNLPSAPGTSRLSPHLHFGEISPRQIIHKLYRSCADVQQAGSGAEVFAKEIVWREFAYHLLFHFPHMIDEPLDKRFEQFPWRSTDSTDALLERWQQGQTGVPIVDAGMRELWHTGWMHNRVRMIVGSFLIKNLLIPWQYGEHWFRDTLVDADLASNAMGWQWVAGCGADAAPFFRVFNPVLQGEKFDKQGGYVRRWVPELEGVPEKFLHKPWELSASDYPVDYPHPIADLKASRQAALAAFDAIKRR